MQLKQLQCNWLIDTGASISVVKYDRVVSLQIPFHKQRLRINGIGGSVYSNGFVYLKLNVNELVFEHKFYVFEKIPCNTDGILGQDFLQKYKSILDFELNTLHLTTENEKSVSLKLQYFDNHNYSYLTVPARSETIHYFDTNILVDCVVNSQELCNGVYIANTIGRPRNGKIPYKIMNTRDEDVTLNYFRLYTTKLSDYFICQFNTPTINAERVKQLFSLLKLDSLNDEEQKSIENICAKFPDVFFLAGDKLTTTSLYEQTIHLKPQSSPVYVKPYRLPQAQKAEIDRQIQRMLDDGVIEETRSAWSSPLLLVPKKVDPSGIKKWRVVLDYRKLNNQIQDDKFPLPNISDILDSLSGAVYFTTLDLYQGFYQINLHKDSRPYTAFTTSKNQYQMTRLAMGLKTSPSAFSRMITVAMSGLNYEQCLIYLDDLCVFGRNLENHNKNLMDVLARLRKVNLKLNPVKCKFLQKEILFLGHVVSENGVSPDPSKTQALKYYPRPHSTEEVKRFVAFANYYRKFITHFAEKAYPLNKLCTKRATFLWTEDCEKAFQELKSALTNSPVLQYPDFSDNNEFLLQTDASGIAIGSVLCNRDGRPVAYASRSLNKAEMNYPTIEKELLAIVWSVKYFRPYLYGRRFKIQTDHRPLVYLFGMRDPTSRLMKFRLQLEEYNFVIEYIKGAKNSAADALSRIILSSKDLQQMSERTVNIMTRAQARRLQESKQAQYDPNLTANNHPQHSRPDQPRVVEIIKKPRNLIELRLINKNKLDKFEREGLITEKTYYFVYVPSKLSIFINRFSRSSITRDVLVRDLSNLCRKLSIEEVCIIKDKHNEEFIARIVNEIKASTQWSGPRLYILKSVQRINNEDDKRVILNDFHLLPTSGHAGIRRMSSNIKKFYYWPSMDRDINQFVSKCEQCQKQKHSIKTKQPMEITTTSSYALEKIYLDIVGPLPKDDTGHCYALTLQCELSKFVEAYPLHSKDAVSVAKAFVNNFILRYGIPREIATDRGTEFVSNTMVQVCELLKIKQLTSTAYHHESIGALENTHKTLGAYLRIYCENRPNSWSSWLPYWCFAHNNTVHTETKYTPHELVFGKTCKLPNNYDSGIDPLYNFDSYPQEFRYRLQVAQEDARKNLLESKVKRKASYDKSLNPKIYKVGNYLLVKNEKGNKIDKVYLGPFLIIKDLGCNVQILKNGKEVIVHKNRTKPYKM